MQIGTTGRIREVGVPVVVEDAWPLGLTAGGAVLVPAHLTDCFMDKVAAAFLARGNKVNRPGGLPGAYVCPLLPIAFEASKSVSEVANRFL